MAMQVSDPLSPRRGYIEASDRLVEVGRDAGPIKVRKALHEVRGRRIAELAVEPDLLELVVERVRLLEVERIAELADQIRGLDEPPLSVFRHILRAAAHGKARELNR